MNQFKIIVEQTLNYQDKSELYLMLIKHNDNYFIEVNSRTSRVGRRQVRSRREGDVVFSQMQERLQSYCEIKSVVELLNLAFKMKTIREHMFLVNFLNDEIELKDIWQIKKQYQCYTHPISPTDLLFDNGQFKNTIAITFPSQKLPLGFFKALNGDAKFRFELGETFLQNLK